MGGLSVRQTKFRVGRKCRSEGEMTENPLEWRRRLDGWGKGTLVDFEGVISLNNTKYYTKGCRAKGGGEKGGPKTSSG